MWLLVTASPSGKRALSPATVRAERAWPGAQLQAAGSAASVRGACRPPAARQDRGASNLASLFHQSQNPNGTTKT